MADEGEFPKIDGDILFASEINDFHSPIQQIYVGSGFDSTQSGSGTDTQDHELDAVTAVNGRNYVKVKITGKAAVTTQSGETASGDVQVKAQIKEIGQSYADIVVYTTILDHSGNTRGGSGIINTYTYEIIATLTAGMKTNGFQIKIFSLSTGANVSGSGSFTNIQTVQELA